MSNPTLLVEQFNGSLGAFSGVDPIRYDSGLWLEEAETNYVNNPVGATDTTGWSVQTDVTLSAESVLPGPLPGWLATRVTTGFKITATANKSGNLAIGAATVPGVATYPVRVYLWIPTAFSATVLNVRGTNFLGQSQTDGTPNIAFRDQWQEITATVTPIAGDLVGSVLIRTTSGTMLSGETLWFTLAEIQPGTYLTSPVAETLGSGYANTSTAHNSPSTRAASSASIATAGILSPSAGAIAFRATPTIVTGVEEIWFEAGVKGSGTDHVQGGRDASKHPFVEWSSNNAAYQRTTATQTVDALTQAMIYLDYTGTTTAIQVGSNAAKAGARAAVSASFGAGPLNLKASAGGVIVDGIATFSEPLQPAQIAKLNDTPVWSMGTLSDNILNGIVRLNLRIRG